MKKKDFTQTLFSALELPRDICQGKMKCTAYGNRELLIENSKCILEYSCDEILIKGKNEKVHICGRHLLIAEYTKEYIRIYGEIEDIHFVW